jgi:hypothetical protein
MLPVIISSRVALCTKQREEESGGKGERLDPPFTPEFHALNVFRDDGPL